MTSPHWLELIADAIGGASSFLTAATFTEWAQTIHSR